mmetsp:Transcript_109301/g.352850  ORF Transcript_109301/g.352850 Transcript_109301/m.352850 type:complete len:319 (-) Transcript_109301:693-1649(-)
MPQSTKALSHTCTASALGASLLQHPESSQRGEVAAVAEPAHSSQRLADRGAGAHTLALSGLREGARCGGRRIGGCQCRLARNLLEVPAGVPHLVALLLELLQELDGAAVAHALHCRNGLAIDGVCIEENFIQPTDPLLDLPVPSTGAQAAAAACIHGALRRALSGCTAARPAPTLQPCTRLPLEGGRAASTVDPLGVVDGAGSARAQHRLNDLSLLIDGALAEDKMKIRIVQPPGPPLDLLGPSAGAQAAATARAHGVPLRALSGRAAPRPQLARHPRPRFLLESCTSHGLLACSRARGHVLAVPVSNGVLADIGDVD